MARWALTVGSLAFHGVLLGALGGLRAVRSVDAIPIAMTESVKPTPVTDPLPPPEEKRAPTPTTRGPVPKATAAPAPASAPAAGPDLGLELSGATGGSGLAVPPPATAAVATPAPVVRKTLAAAAPTAEDACADPPAKPKLLDLPQPAYTEDARSAGIEGKVRIEITVDETGRVVEARALTSLGHGLDEAALASARSARFEPALRCGKPSRSTFTLSVRFAAG